MIDFTLKITSHQFGFLQWASEGCKSEDAFFQNSRQFIKHADACIASGWATHRMNPKPNYLLTPKGKLLLAWLLAELKDVTNPTLGKDGKHD